MANFSVDLSGRLAVPLQLAWAALTDLAAAPEWLDRVEESDADASDLAWSEARWRVGRRWIRGTVVELEAPRRLVLRLRDATSLLPELRVTVRVAAADRGTSFRVEVSGDASGIALALRPWLRLRAEIELHRAVRGFRAWIEERARVRSAEPRPAPSIVLSTKLAGADLVGA
jgi:uncharacterized protein YndB with AHSA1/START domain